ncbi:MAG: carboxypeptidase regulatory-like domain-containing protein [Bryobacteraceae bacterium]
MLNRIRHARVAACKRISRHNPVLGLLVAVCMLLFISSPALGQTAFLRGQIVDQSGAVVPKATVTLAGPSGLVRTITAAENGSYLFAGLPAGEYIVRAAAPQLEQQPVKIALNAGTQTLRLELKVAAMQQQTTVQETANASVSTDSANNASALILRGKDLESLADDPEDLATDLQALAGPSAGPGGSSVFIDGFSGGQLPSKDAIREIRINQNPFSPEYDKLGFGRVEILTKPGADRFHGAGYYNFGDSIWNSRNPYAAQKAPFLLKEYGGSLEGPLSKLASFFLTVDRAAIDNGAIINGTILDPNTLAIINPYTQVFRIPQRRIRVSPRIDYQVTPTDTLSVRYAFSSADIQHSGIGGFNLVSTGIHNRGNDQTGQIANTLVLGPRTLNETRFQFYRANISSLSENPSPRLDVLNSFIGGGAQVGNSFNTLDTYELQNYTTGTRDKHTLRFGMRVRAATLDNSSPINFGGSFTFAGRVAPELNAENQPVLDSLGQPELVNIDSIESYRRTLLFEHMGLPAAQIRTLGGGAAQFAINAGNPSLSVNQEDVGAFIGDDWHPKPNLTLNLGLRYEWQTNLHDCRDAAPRLGFAWAPGGGKPGSSPKTVIRAGFGMFYQRFDISDLLTAERYNGLVQQQYVVINPNFYPSVPSISSLAVSRSQQTVQQLSANLRAPYLLESAVAVERQLPAHATFALTYVNSHGLHQFLTNDVNAPLPGSFNSQASASGIYPLGNPNPVFLVESSGLYNQNELIANVTSKLNDSVSLFGSYLYNHAMSNTDYSPPPQNTDFNPAISNGALGVGTFPANPYSMSGEYGPASTDIRHQVTVGGSIAGKWGLRFSPLFTVDSGAPFNITVGHDLYGNTLFNGRPGIAKDANRSGLVSTSYGLLDPNPLPGETILPRNYGRGPSIIMLNIRISKTFAFGPAGEGSVSTGGGRRTQGGPFSVGGSGGGSTSTGHRYNLTISLSTRNVLNRNNPGPIIGNIASPLFGLANQPYGTGSLGGTGFSESADNRRLELQTRFTF